MQTEILAVESQLQKIKINPGEVWDGEIKSLGKHSTGVPEFSCWLTVYIPSY